MTAIAAKPSVLHAAATPRARKTTSTTESRNASAPKTTSANSTKVEPSGAKPRPSSTATKDAGFGAAKVKDAVISARRAEQDRDRPAGQGSAGQSRTGADHTRTDGPWSKLAGAGTEIADGKPAGKQQKAEAKPSKEEKVQARLEKDPTLGRGDHQTSAKVTTSEGEKGTVNVKVNSVVPKDAPIPEISKVSYDENSFGGGGATTITVKDRAGNSHSGDAFVGYDIESGETFSPNDQKVTADGWKYSYEVTYDSNGEPVAVEITGADKV